MADASPRTDTSTDVDHDDKNPRVIYFSLFLEISVDGFKEYKCVSFLCDL